MEKKTIADYPTEWVIKRTKSIKPIRNSEGAILYKTALQYLVRVIPQDYPGFDFLLNLASFATSNALSDAQAKEADKYINYFEKQGVL